MDSDEWIRMGLHPECRDTLDAATQAPGSKGWQVFVKVDGRLQTDEEKANGLPGERRLASLKHQWQGMPRHGMCFGGKSGSNLGP